MELGFRPMRRAYCLVAFKSLERGPTALRVQTSQEIEGYIALLLPVLLREPDEADSGELEEAEDCRRRLPLGKDQCCDGPGGAGDTG